MGGIGSSQKLRLLYIFDFLRLESDEDNPVPSERIISMLADRGIETHRKSIYADITALMEYDVDIVYLRGKNGGYFIATREFEVPEVRLLIDAVLSAGFITPNKTSVLVEKLERLTSRQAARQIKSQIYVLNNHKHTNEKIYYNIDVISRAIDLKCKISLDFKKREISDSGEISDTMRSFILSPYALAWWNEHYYLICNYEKYDTLMHMRLDRIVKVALIKEQPFRHFSEVSEYKHTFDTADYMSRVFGMFGGISDKIELRCDNSLFETVTDRFGHNTTVRPGDDGYFIIRADALISEGLVAWILQFGTKIEVLKSDELRELLRKKARELRALYKV